MRRLNFRGMISVVLSGFAGMSCLTNLQAQDTVLDPDTIFNVCTTEKDSDLGCDSCQPATGCYGAGEGCYGAPSSVCRSSPLLYFQVDHLLWSRDNNVSAGSIIGGPDALSYDNLDFGFDYGYRIKAAIATGRWEFETAWTKIDNWNTTQNGQLTTGLSFDQGIATSFAGANFINATTYFQPLFNAASADLSGGGGPNEQLEDEGFGPVGVFADPAATYVMQYRSDLQDLEVMIKYAPVNRRFKLGAGWRHVDLDELASVGITGTFRAVDNAVGANGGLSHNALIDPNGGNLTLLSGAADGFDDETALLGGAGPDQLRLLNNATTDNSLNGIQFSLEALLFESQNWLIDGFIKAGAYHNQTDGVITETYSGIANDNSVYGRTLTSNQSSVAFVGQTGIAAIYRINDNIRLRAGWEVLFLSGVALAPDQNNGIIGNVYNIQNDGNMIANGGNVGLELVY